MHVQPDIVFTRQVPIGDDKVIGAVQRYSGRQRKADALCIESALLQK